jgi:YYY domain-containing protein
MSVSDNDNPIAAAPEAPSSGPAVSRQRLEAAAVLFLIIILAVAAWFRFTGLTWDDGSHLHPDERFLTMVGSSITPVGNPLDYLRTSISTLNPYVLEYSFYVYGNFPMTVTRYAGEWADGVCDMLAGAAGARPAWCGFSLTGYDGIHLVGRFLSALVDLISVLFTFLIGRRLYGVGAGLFAALLLALAVMPIQQSHFFTMDNWATVFTTLAIYAAVRAATIGDAEPRWRLRWYALFGLALGLAAASRINMAPLALVIGVSAVVWLARRKSVISNQYSVGQLVSWSVSSGQSTDSSELVISSDDRSRHSELVTPSARGLWSVVRGRDFERALIGIALAAVVSILTFRVAQPYAFADAEMLRAAAVAETGEAPNAFVLALKSIVSPNPQFLSNMAEIQAQQAPEAGAPPALQWVDRPAILFPMSNMILYGIGLTAGLFAWFALLWALWRMISRQSSVVSGQYSVSSNQYSVGQSVSGSVNQSAGGSELVTRHSSFVTPEWMLHAIPVFWTLTYFLYMGTRWVKSIRYFLPIYPTLFVLAGWAIVFLWRRASQYTVGQWVSRSVEGGRSAVVGRRRSAVNWRQVAVATLAALVVLPSLLWAVAFTRIYRQPMTRIAASEWIYDNVPSGATLLYSAADGQSRELNLPLKGMFFEFGGAPLYLDFNMPEDGIIRGVRFNYLSDPVGQAAEDGETIRVRLNDGETVEQALALDGQRRAVVVELPPTPVTGGAPLRLTTEAGPGGSFNAGTSLLVNELWDDLLPVGLDGRNAYGSYYTEVTGGQRPVIYPDSPEKREEALAWLDEADYIMLSSQRAMWSLPRIPQTFPMMMKYYEALFSGELGFDLVAQFHGDTRLGPLHISDTTGQISWGEPPRVGWPPPGALAAEEAFSVYDHPPVWIFRKSDRYDPAAARALLESVDLSNVVVLNPLEATKAKSGMMLSAAESAIQRAGGAFDEVFDVDSPLSNNPWLAAAVWAAAVILLGWAAFPITYTALRGLPDRGYALSRVLALLLLSYLPWLAASLKLLPFTRGTILLALAAILILSAALFVRRRAEMLAFVRARARYILLVELLGLALFALMIGIRLGNPDVWDVIWGGEKPMDLSYFTAVMRSTIFPPYDPWLSGGYINYYYYGFVFIGALTKLLGIVPTVAYNLALPMLFSMTGLGVFSLAWNLVTAAPDLTGAAPASLNPEEPDARAAPVRSFWNALRSRAAVAGFVAVALALLLGNLAQVTTISNAWYMTGAASLEEIPVVGRAARIIDGGVKMIGGQPAPMYPGDWFWNASRAINAEPGEVQPITEFPYFTFLYADLHAHMIAMPLTMLALGWAIGVVLSAQGRRGAGEQGSKDSELVTPSSVGGRPSQPVSRTSYLVSLLVGALAIGVLRPTNTWDWPTYLLLGVLAVVYYVVQVDGFSWRSLGKAALVAAALVGLSALAFLPYTANYGAAYSSVSLWPGSYTRAWNYLLVYGLFLFFVVTHVVREFRDWTASWTEAGKRRLAPYGGPILIAAGVFVILNAYLLARGYWVAPIALPLLTAAGLLALRPGLPAARRIVLALMSAALGLSLLVEIVVLDGDVGRMNTVFKFYLQAWLMLSVACGPAAVWAWSAIRGAKRLRTAWTVALGILVFAALLYPLTATPARWNIRMNRDAPNTLDGAAFLDYVEYGDTDYQGIGVTVRPGEDVAAIRWLQRNVDGSPVIMEAHGSNPYRSIASRVAMYTGLPTVVGWDWHQRQQRAAASGTVVTDRIEDVNTFYNTPDTAVARNILRQYGVEYVFVGSLERAYYRPEGLAKFDQMVAEGELVEVFRDEFARIFRVAGGM